MESNMDLGERVVRSVAGTVLVAWWLVTGSKWGILGILALISGILGYCPLYTLIDAFEKKRGAGS